MSIFSLSARKVRHLPLLACFLCLGALAGRNAHAAEARFVPEDMRACPAASVPDGHAFPCKEALRPAEIAVEIDKLKEQDFVYTLAGDTLTVSLRMSPAQLPFPDGPFLCCELQGYLDKVGEDIYTARFQWNRMETALLDLRLLGVESSRPLARIIHFGAPVYLSGGGKAETRGTPVPAPN